MFQLLRALWLVKFRRPYSIARPAKFKAVFVAKTFRDLSPSTFNFYQVLNLAFILNYVLRDANDYTMISEVLSSSACL